MPNPSPRSLLDPERWLQEHGNYLYRYALAMARNEEIAEDAVQECLLAALESAERYQGGASERTWLTSILRNKVCDAIRRHSRETTMAQAEDVFGEHGEEEDAARFNRRGHWAVPLADWGDPARSLENKRFWQALNACLERLPPRLAQLFMLRELAGMETENICQEMEISSTNLWTMLYRSRMGLRQCLEKNDWS